MFRKCVINAVITLSDRGTMLLMNGWLIAKSSPVAMLQHATSSQSFVIHQPQSSSSASHLAAAGAASSSIGQSRANQANYEYKYEVSDQQTGDRKSHWETREGDKVRGVYTLYEPDGALRRVEYSADAVHGFNAIVTRDGQTKHHPPQDSARNNMFSRRPSEGYEPSGRGYIPSRGSSAPVFGGDRVGYPGRDVGAGFSVSHVPNTSEARKPY